MNYRIDYLADGLRARQWVAARTAAAAVDHAQTQVTADRTVFELLSVNVVEERDSDPDDSHR